MTVFRAPMSGMPPNSALSPALRRLLRGAEVGGGALFRLLLMTGGSATILSVFLVRLSMNSILRKVAGDWASPAPGEQPEGATASCGGATSVGGGEGCRERCLRL